MAQSPELTLFMLVTNRDCVLAHYAVRSYRKVWRLYPSFVLEVYANCLTDEKKRFYFRQWEKLPYVRIRDNEAQGKITRKKGSHFTTPEGIRLQYDENCEHYDEVWTREHQLSQTRFWGTVDADFEILEPQFLLSMMDSLRSDPSLGGMSSDYSETSDDVLDTYSNEIIKINERWHTWCCIYRQETGRYLSEVSTFYFERILPSGKRHAFDSYAFFQQHLIRNGYRMGSVGPEFQRQFIHYGAFSKNKSITRSNIHLYRWLAISVKRGLIPPSFSTILNDVSRRLSLRLFDVLFSKSVAERRVYDFESS